MSSRPVKTIGREWPAPDWVPPIIGAGLAILIIISGPVPGYGQAPQGASSPQSGAPAPAPPSAEAASQAAPPATAAEPRANVLPPIEQTASTELPRDLSPLGMFMSADIIVKAVMIGLIFASLLTWAIRLAKSLELWGARRRVRRAQRVLEHAQSFAEAAVGARLASRQIAWLVAAVEAEIRSGAQVGLLDPRVRSLAQLVAETSR